MNATSKNEVSILPQLDKACGLDMHKDKIVGFISTKDGEEQDEQEFGTFTEDLYKIRDWLLSHNVHHCLMESTGVYWIALYSLLTQSGIDVVVANGQHIKQIPKRKTDRKDARWLCTLMLHGLVKRSLIPGKTQRQMRSYCRRRLSYQQSRSRSFNRIIKLLETHNIKLRSVLSNIHTKTATGMIELLSKGITDIDQLLACAKGRAKTKEKEAKFRQALNVHLDSVVQEELQMLLEDVRHFDFQITKLTIAIDEMISQHYKTEIECLDSISGIGKQTAEIIISEIGTNMDKFPSADHLTSWCGVAPGNNESAGKQRTVSVKKGNKYLRLAIIAAAWGAVRTKNSYWRALFTNLCKRMKSQKAIVVIARRLLKVVFKTIRSKTIYQEKGIQHYYDLRNRAITVA